MRSLFFFVFLGGQPWLFGFINCFVHVIMYSYYFGSVYSTKLKTNYFIKRSITQLQIVSHCCPFVDPFIQSKMAELIVVKNFTFFLQIQFVLSIIHLSIPFFTNDCSYPKKVLVIAISQNLVMLLLFSDFYYNSYIKPKRTKVKSN